MVITVTQYNNFIKGILDSEPILFNIGIKGEVTNLREGYDCYFFSLKDETSQVECYYRTDARSKRINNGMQITAVGSPNFYVPYGKLSFTVRSIEQGDLGAAYLRFLQLKKKLEKEGCFDQSKKKTVPADCAKIGVVTSARGAVITDIEQIALRRNPNVQIYLYPSKVQGVGSELELSAGIDYFSDADVDVVIVGRGGGSDEDLSAFNTEEVVRAVCRCKKPIVSAVGHGIDYTLCDFACDIRTATPSEAAEMVTADYTARINSLNGLVVRMHRALEMQMTVYDSRIRLLTSRMSQALTVKTDGIQNALTAVCARLSVANPKRYLELGYALVTADGIRISAAEQLTEEQKIELRFADGKRCAVICGSEPQSKGK